MVDLFKFLIVFIGVSAMLYLTYIVYLRYRCNYNLARVYLLSIPVVAMLSASVTFNIIPLPGTSNIQAQTIGTLIDDFAEDIQEVSPQEDILHSESSNHIVVDENIAVESPVNAALTQEEVVRAEPSPSVEGRNIGNVFDIILILGVLYLVGVVIRLIIVSIQVRKIMSIKRWATRENFNDITLYRSGLIDTPFSFIRNIFIDRGVEGDKLQMIVQHELSHIENKHYLDKNIVEMMCAFMWFNPIVWCVRNELGAIHEFQADNNLIKDGVDVKTYQHYLFEEIMGKSPSIANGFNHSLIKKRMIMMMRSQTFKNSVVKTSVAIVSLIIVFISVSFKQVELEAVIESAIEYQPLVAVDYHDEVAESQLIVFEDIIVEDIVIDDVVLDDIIVENVIIDDIAMVEKELIPATAVAPVAPAVPVAPVAPAVPVAPANKDNLVASGYYRGDINAIEKDTYNTSGWYLLDKDQVKGMPDYITLSRKSNKNRTGVVGIKVTPKHTLVDYVIRVTHDPGLLIFSERTFLRDQVTNDMYKIRSIEGKIPLGEILMLSDYRNQYASFTLVFPPLDKNIEKVDFLELNSETGAQPIGSWRKIYDIDVQELKVIKAESVRIIE